jgi:type IV secretory pathway VirB3-like protein
MQEWLKAQQRTFYSHGIGKRVRFYVLTAASMKMAAFWGVAAYSIVEIDRRFRG